MKSSVMMLVAFFAAGFIFVSCSMDENTITNSSGSMEKLNGNAVKGPGHFTEDEIVVGGNGGEVIVPEDGAKIIFTSRDQYGNLVNITEVNFMIGDSVLGWGYMLLSQYPNLNHTATLVPVTPEKYGIVSVTWSVNNATINGSNHQVALNFSTNYFTNLSQGMTSLPRIDCSYTMDNNVNLEPESIRMKKSANTESWTRNFKFYLHIVRENGNFER